MARGTPLLAVLLVASVCIVHADIIASGKWKGLDDLKKSFTATKRAEERSMMEHEEGPEDTSPKYFKMTPPVMDADASVGALLGDPDNIPCSMIAELGFCGFDPFWAVCPKSCGYPEGYCEGDKDDIYRSYMQALAPDFDMQDFTCKDVAPRGRMAEPLKYPNGDSVQPCADGAIAMLCAETCKTNCWSLPPLRQTKVYLPGCHLNPAVTAFDDSMLIAKDAQRLMYNVVSDPSREKQCPPATSP